MSETPVSYRANLLQKGDNLCTMDTELDALRDHLPDLERLLTSLLVKVQVAQGKEPSVMSRAERRGR